MTEYLPDYLIQGERARLFPVLSVTSHEGRATSVLLSCIARIHEFGAVLLSDLGQRIGSRAQVDAYTEIVLKKDKAGSGDRPDGLLVVRVGKREWRVLIEAKIGNATVRAEQVERYRALAKEVGIDCVLTISNQFATTPNRHPDPEIRKSKSKVPVFHWSWMHVLTAADLLLSQGEVADPDQEVLLNELRRFLSHESTGVKGFTRMPKAWSDLNKLVSTGGVIPQKSEEALEVVGAWHQETRDLTLILSRLTETFVTERMPKKHMRDPFLRQKAELALLRETYALESEIVIPDAAAPLRISCDLRRRTIDVGLQLRAPDDRRSTKARVNWLLRQLSGEVPEDTFVRLLWPGTSEATIHSVSALKENVDLASEGKEHLTVHSFEVFLSRRIGARFAQQVNFISDLEQFVPDFYRTVGSKLVAWKKKPPKIKDETGPADVSTDAISLEAEAF